MTNLFAPKKDTTKERAKVNLDVLIKKVDNAQKVFAEFSQEKVDQIFKSAAMAANKERVFLAKLAHIETGMGVVEDKITKNHFASEYIYNKYKNTKTCGEIERDDLQGIVKIAEPLGLIAGIIPTTNPTSTTIFKALLALKTRNAIIFSPHPRAKISTVQAAKIVLDAAVKAGAPEDIIGWIDSPSVGLSKQLMEHPKTSTILATGGPGMVKAAYSSGKPAIGVGSGNTPVIIDSSADIKMAVSSIIMSKTFDNGMICASEQSVIILDSIYDEVIKEFAKQGTYFLNTKEREMVEKTIVKNGKLNPEIVGRPAVDIAKLADIKVSMRTKILAGEVNGVGKHEPFSYEKLSPVLAFYRAGGFDQAINRATSLIEFGGMGHTSVLYANPGEKEKIGIFSKNMKTGRTLINMPSSHGAIGDLYNFSLAPSLTLGCGSWGGNSVSVNVATEHLLNVKTVAQKQENMLWFRIPEKVYFKRGCLTAALDDLQDKKRAFIVTDNYLLENNYLDILIKKLETAGTEYSIFSDIQPDPTVSTAQAGARAMAAFNPDVIIAIGGGSPMDAAKIMWLLYEHPDVQFEDLAMRFMDIRKRVYQFPELGQKADLVAIPTTSGTGSEVTPFAVITDDKTGIKYPIADYQLTPTMAICDADLVKNMPKSLTAYSGIDALTHAIEAYISMYATEYTKPMALEAIDLLFTYLPRAYNYGADDMAAREKVHHASTIAGMAFSNAFLGICHSMAHKVGSFYRLPHGLANALLISKVVKFNAEEAPTKMGTLPQYTHPQAKEGYAKIAKYIGLSGKTDDEYVDALIGKIEELKVLLNVPLSIRDAGIEEDIFLDNLDEIAEAAFDDQCTGANPRLPLIEEIKDLLTDAYYGR